MAAGAHKCTFCKHVYMLPCDGKNKKCLNKWWITEGKTASKKQVKTPKKKRVRV